MKLKSFGCSFVFGTDLADASDGSDTLEILPSQQTWPALTAQRLGMSYECWARAGAGNLQILEQVLNQIPHSDNDLFVISWTWIDRFDCYNPQHRDTDYSAWRTITPTANTPVADTYYRHMHSEYQDKLMNLSWIKMAIEVLMQQRMPFVMTYADELLFDQRWNTSSAVQYLQNQVQPYMTLFEGKTFLQWSREHGFPESTGWHPLEAAHSAATDVIIQAFDTRNKDGLVQRALF